MTVIAINCTNDHLLTLSNYLYAGFMLIGLMAFALRMVNVIRLTAMVLRPDLNRCNALSEVKKRNAYFAHRIG